MLYQRDKHQQNHKITWRNIFKITTFCVCSTLLFLVIMIWFWYHNIAHDDYDMEDIKVWCCMLKLRCNSIIKDVVNVLKCLDKTFGRLFIIKMVSQYIHTNSDIHILSYEPKSQDDVDDVIHDYNGVEYVDYSYILVILCKNLMEFSDVENLWNFMMWALLWSFLMLRHCWWHRTEM